MSQVFARILPLCVVLVIHNVSSVGEDWWKQADHYLIVKLNFPLKLLHVYQDLISKAQIKSRDCALNHTQRFEVLNRSIDYHWQACLKTAPSYNVYLLLVCMEDRAHGDVDILLQDITALHGCMDERENATQRCPDSLSSVADWAEQVAEVKNNLPVVKKRNEFYVAVENAKLANRTNCYDEFFPLVNEYTASIDLVINSCNKFVPKGRLEEFEKCCNDLSQPILSDIQTKLMYAVACGAYI